MTYAEQSRSFGGEMCGTWSATQHTLKRIGRASSTETASRNMLVHGENLAVLHALKSQYSGSVRCAYLDPPYNNGESYEHYYDSMGHEEWLESVSERLKAIAPLLREDGSVWISIDDSELHYLKVAADAIFGRGNFIGTIVWERRTTRENRRVLSRNHEYLVVYAKNAALWTKTRNALPLTAEIVARYKNLDADPRGAWQSVSANVQSGHATPQQFYAIKTPSGVTYEAPKGRCWVYSKKKMMEEIAKNNVWFGREGSGVPRIKKFLSEKTDGVTPETLWRAADVGTTTDAKKHLIALFDSQNLFDTPKPESLLRRILHISTNPGDLVLDPYLGSGTTAAVAHKMGRNYIGIEIGDHVRTHCAHRLGEVMRGEQGGISKEVGWSGGGDFNFYRLAEGSKKNGAK